MTQTEIFAAIVRERVRQERAMRDGKFKYTCACSAMSNSEKVLVLAEEFGEVCCAVLNVQNLSTDGPERSRLANELIEMAAVATAWLESLTELQK